MAYAYSETLFRLRKVVLTPATAWMNLGHMKQSEICQSNSLGYLARTLSCGRSLEGCQQWEKILEKVAEMGEESTLSYMVLGPQMSVCCTQ